MSPMSEAGGKPNQRTLARLGAVQALYQMDMTSLSLNAIIQDYENYRWGQEIDGLPLAKADKGHFRDLVRGVVADQRIIDPLINAHLAAGWRLARLDSILRAILRSGVFELRSKTEIPVKVVITEYIDIAHAFFSGDEPKVVNGILDHLGRELRAAEFATSRKAANG